MGAKNDRETTRAGVIGDIHGDYGLFLSALGVECHARCDAEAAGHMSGRHTCWPENLWVIQLGDQIHRGRDGNLVLRMRDKLRAHSGGHYVDLWGNHEAQYRGGPKFWRDRGDEIDPALLDPDNSRAAAAAIVTDRRVWVASHAGITRGWVEASTATSDIDPSDPVELVREANRQWVRGDRLLFAAGAMLGHLDRFGRVRRGMTNRAAGPLWAEIGSEDLDS